MKGKKLLSLLLTLTLILGLCVPAMAEDTSFEDLEGHWAKEYVEDMLRRGMVNGYSDGLFHPDDPVVESTGLALCGRVMVPFTSPMRTNMIANREKDVAKLVPDSSAWFRKDAAVCLEQGIITPDELTALAESDRLDKPMIKADFAVYLVRAMGLTDLAQPSMDIELHFQDADEIDEFYVPYVHLLSVWGVLEGDEVNNFNPTQSMTRGVCATMLSRTLKNVVEARGVKVEMPLYDVPYPFTAGTIQSVENLTDGNRELRLLNPVKGPESVVLPSATPIYQYNKIDSFTALKEGAYAKVCYTADGEDVAAVRVIPQGLIDSISGACSAVSQSSITTSQGSYTIDRFTLVSAGGKTGGPEIIDPQSGYTTASLSVDSQGRVLWLLLSGGTRALEGILTDVTTETVGLKEKTTLVVTSYNGMPTTYQVDETLAATADGAPTVLTESYKGRHVTLRVSDSDQSQLQSIDVNMTQRYVQGVLRAVTSTDEPRKVELNIPGVFKPTPYELSEDCAVSYMGSDTALKSIPTGSFVTGKVEGGTLTMLSAWRGYEDTEGTVYDLRMGDPTILEVATESGSVVKFSIPRDRLDTVDVTSKGNSSSITKLRTGDQVVVTCLYSDVTKILFTPQEATVFGVVDTMTIRSDETRLITIRFSNGETADYTATPTTSVTQGDAPATIYDLRVGAQVSLVLEGEYIASVSINGAAVSKQSKEGTVYQKDEKARTLTLLVMDNITGKQNAVTVSVPSGITILDVTTGKTLTNITHLGLGDTLQVYGDYNASGVFVATSVIRK